jgi:hypothetical protein
MPEKVFLVREQNTGRRSIPGNAKSSAPKVSAGPNFLPVMQEEFREFVTPCLERRVTTPIA